MNTIQTLEVANAIHERHAVREYLSAPVERERLQELLVEATQAPSAMNLQPWAFAVFEGVERLRGFSDRAREHLLATHPEFSTLVPPGTNIFHDAPALIVICATDTRQQSAEDCSLAAENLMLFAHAAGLATCPIGFAREWLNLPSVKHDLGIPTEMTPVFPVVVGYPKGSAEPHGRRDPVIISWVR